MTRLHRALTHYARTCSRIDLATRTGNNTTTETVQHTQRQWENEARQLGATTTDLAAAHTNTA
ncbi:hypothetical protein CH267_00070 [Rhodococcus sp. 06-621-2]|nr:hypothetical protein [Rhodococcus sp. 06-621-2]OZC62793.1 hypothetical protein CH267_00070 [Rhodococcus sp. 06-621-2]